MGDKKGPAIRIKLKAKSGDMTAKNRDGKLYKGPQVEVISIWENDNGMLSGKLAEGFAITFEGKKVPDHFINVYDERTGSTKAKGGRKAADEDDDF